MATSFDSSVFDNGLNHVIGNGNKLVLVKGIPTTYTDANNLDTDVPAGIKVAEEALAGGDYTLADRVGGGREVTVAAKSGVTALDGSQASDDLHVAVLDTVAQRVLVLTDEATNQPITAGNPINIPAFSFYLGAAVG